MFAIDVFDRTESDSRSGKGKLSLDTLPTKLINVLIFFYYRLTIGWSPRLTRWTSLFGTTDIANVIYVWTHSIMIKLFLSQYQTTCSWIQYYNNLSINRCCVNAIDTYDFSLAASFLSLRFHNDWGSDKCIWYNIHFILSRVNATYRSLDATYVFFSFNFTFSKIIYSIFLILYDFPSF